MENYNKVPSIITGKDLDYLCDMFNWNYLAYKKALNYCELVNLEDLKNIFQKASDFFCENMNTVVAILNQGGSNE